MCHAFAYDDNYGDKCNAEYDDNYHDDDNYDDNDDEAGETEVIKMIMK